MEPRNLILGKTTGTVLCLVGVGAVGFGVCSQDSEQLAVTAFTSFLAGFSPKIFARKYLGNNLAMFFAKDVLVVLVYISFYVAKKRRKGKKRLSDLLFLAPLLIFVWFCDRSDI